MKINATRIAGLFGAALLGALAAAPSAQASPMVYTYKLQSTASSPAGLNGTGTFTLSQNPLTVPGFIADSTNVASLITAFDFVIDGQTFNVFNVATNKPDPNGLVSNLEFNSNGTLFNITFQGDNKLNAQGYQSTLFLNGSTFAYSNQLDGASASGNLVLTANPPAKVPEPVTLSLFGAGLAGAAAMRRRKAAKT